MSFSGGVFHQQSITSLVGSRFSGARPSFDLSLQHNEQLSAGDDGNERNRGRFSRIESRSASANRLKPRPRRAHRGLSLLGVAGRRLGSPSRPNRASHRVTLRDRGTLEWFGGRRS